MVVAALLEGPQAFTPNRHFYLPAVFYGAGAVLAAALVAKFFIRAWRLHKTPSAYGESRESFSKTARNPSADGLWSRKHSIGTHQPIGDETDPLLRRPVELYQS